MSAPEQGALAPVLDLLRGGPSPAWRRATFSGPATGDWDRIVAEPVAVKRGPSVKVVTTAGNSHTTRTVAAAEWGAALEEILGFQPRNIHVAVPDGEWHARRGKRRWLVSLGRPSSPAVSGGGAGLPGHDRPRRHLLDPADPAVRALLVEAGIIGRSGQIRGQAVSKYRQIQHFLDLLRPLSILNARKRKSLRIVDAGCGAAHLGLALYLYASRLGLKVSLTGIDRNELVVEKAAERARRLRFPAVKFLAADVERVTTEELGRVDILVSLHLCDTGTDDALTAGIRSRAAAIVLAPCCQHELAPQLAAAELTGADSALVRHGAVRERLASLLTDEFRILALESAGYHVDIADFTGPENTAKNLLIRAERRGRGLSQARRAAARETFAGLARRWGVRPACAAALDLPGQA